MKKTDELLAMVQDINSWNGGMPHLDVFDMESFNEMVHGLDPTDIAMKIFYGDFNPNHEYFGFNGYGNLESFSSHELEDELLECESEIREIYAETFE